MRPPLRPSAGKNLLRALEVHPDEPGRPGGRTTRDEGATSGASNRRDPTRKPQPRQRQGRTHPRPRVLRPGQAERFFPGDPLVEQGVVLCLSLVFGSFFGVERGKVFFSKLLIGVEGALFCEVEAHALGPLPDPEVLVGSGASGLLPVFEAEGLLAPVDQHGIAHIELGRIDGFVEPAALGLVPLELGVAHGVVLSGRIVERVRTAFARAPIVEVLGPVSRLRIVAPFAVDWRKLVELVLFGSRLEWELGRRPGHRMPRGHCEVREAHEKRTHPGKGLLPATAGLSTCARRGWQRVQLAHIVRQKYG